jgi:hypothetical protein
MAMTGKRIVSARTAEKRPKDIKKDRDKTLITFLTFIIALSPSPIINLFIIIIYIDQQSDSQPISEGSFTFDFL